MQPTAAELPKSRSEGVTKGLHQASPLFGFEEKELPCSGNAQDGSTDPDTAACCVHIEKGPNWATPSVVSNPLILPQRKRRIEILNLFFQLEMGSTSHTTWW